MDKATLVSVSVRADNYVLHGLIVASVLGGAAASESRVTAMFGVIFAALTLSYVLRLVLTIFAKLTLARLKARPLCSQGASAALAIVGAESSKMKIDPLPRIYWAPTSRRHLGARVFGGFHRTLVLTGGICVSAERSRWVSEAIIRHELGHLKNEDTWLILLPISIFINMCVGLVTGDWSAALAAVVFGSMLSAFLLRRREYTADAFAVNASSSLDDYVALIREGKRLHGGWFHPPANARARALLEDSPILRTSLLMLLLIGLTTCINLAQVYWALKSWATLLDGLIVSICVLFFPLLALSSELLKGFSIKVPAAAGRPPCS
jgi:Zn-dependent protease with chaperone function